MLKQRRRDALVDASPQVEVLPGAVRLSGRVLRDALDARVVRGDELGALRLARFLELGPDVDRIFVVGPAEGWSVGEASKGRGAIARVIVYSRLGGERRASRRGGRRGRDRRASDRARGSTAARRDGAVDRRTRGRMPPRGRSIARTRARSARLFDPRRSNHPRGGDRARRSREENPSRRARRRARGRRRADDVARVGERKGRERVGTHIARGGEISRAVQSGVVAVGGRARGPNANERNDSSSRSRDRCRTRTKYVVVLITARAKRRARGHSADAYARSRVVGATFPRRQKPPRVRRRTRARSTQLSRRATATAAPRARRARSTRGVLRV